jgi:hypothetical protein
MMIDEIQSRKNSRYDHILILIFFTQEHSQYKQAFRSELHISFNRFTRLATEFNRGITVRRCARVLIYNESCLAGVITVLSTLYGKSI